MNIAIFHQDSKLIVGRRNYWKYGFEIISRRQKQVFSKLDSILEMEILEQQEMLQQAARQNIPKHTIKVVIHGGGKLGTRNAF